MVFGNDARIVSWNLTNTVNEILQAYINCESILSETIKTKTPVISLSVFPNPFHGNITVQMNLSKNADELSFTLTDISGKAVWSSNSKEDFSLGQQTFSFHDFPTLSNGVYFLNVFVDRQLTKTVELIKNE